METYKKNYLTNVLVRVDFEPILALINGVPGDYQDLIRDQLPRLEQAQNVSVLVSGADVKPNAPTSVWKFWSEDRTKVVAVDANSISYECTKFVSYMQFRAELEKVLNSFGSIYKPGIVKRIGLRYINQIRLSGDPFVWDGYINNNLVCAASAFGERYPHIARLMSQMHIVLDDAKVVFQFGNFNSEFPNKISKKEFVLDYDCYTDDECSFSEVGLRVDRFNQIVCDLFEKSIGEAMRCDLREASR